MKAILYPDYGPPERLQLRDVDKPTPEGNQVLVKVRAAAANPLDWHLMRGAPLLVRFQSGLFKPKNARLGADLAGTVQAVGPEVTRFRPGDEVFGCGRGAFAEYACVSERVLVLKPTNVTFEQAAAAPVAGLTALQGMRDEGRMQSGQRVLVNGASGGVGTFAVQLAKAFGTEVTGVCSTRNLDLIRSIGADHVIDYTQEDFSRSGPYDLVFDAVGNRAVADYKRALTPQGICVIAGFTTLPRLLAHVLRGAWASRTGTQQIGLMGTAQPNQSDMVAIQELLETGKVTPVIDRRYPLDETAEAIRYLETGHARGKVIIVLEPHG